MESTMKSGETLVFCNGRRGSEGSIPARKIVSDGRSASSQGEKKNGRFSYDRKFLLGLKDSKCSKRKPQNFPIPELSCTLASINVRTLKDVSPNPMEMGAQSGTPPWRKDEMAAGRRFPVLKNRPHHEQERGGRGDYGARNASGNHARRAYEHFDGDGDRGDYREKDRERERDWWKENAGRKVYRNQNHRQPPPGFGNREHVEADREPEWFSGGPSSRHETMELMGFDDDERLHAKARANAKKEREGRGKDDTNIIELLRGKPTGEKKKQENEQEKNEEKISEKEQREGSMEKSLDELKELWKVEMSQHGNTSLDEEREQEQEHDISGSRFYQFFKEQDTRGKDLMAEVFDRDKGQMSEEGVKLFRSLITAARNALATVKEEANSEQTEPATRDETSDPGPSTSQRHGSAANPNDGSAFRSDHLEEKKKAMSEKLRGALGLANSCEPGEDQGLELLCRLVHNTPHMEPTTESPREEPQFERGNILSDFFRPLNQPQGIDMTINQISPQTQGAPGLFYAPHMMGAMENRGFMPQFHPSAQMPRQNEVIYIPPGVHFPPRQAFQMFPMPNGNFPPPQNFPPQMLPRACPNTMGPQRQPHNQAFPQPGHGLPPHMSGNRYIQVFNPNQMQPRPNVMPPQQQQPGASQPQHVFLGNGNGPQGFAGLFNHPAPNQRGEGSAPQPQPQQRARPSQNEEGVILSSNMPPFNIR